jgi:CBS domain-containing protein
MQVDQVMSRNCRIVNANDTLQKAARIMREENLGALPVQDPDKDRLVGMITDRDIVTRCVASGKDGDARVRDAMTMDVKYCFEDADLDETLENMAEIQLRRLPVVNREKRLVGIISLADAARYYAPDAVGLALSGVVEPAH